MLLALLSPFVPLHGGLGPDLTLLEYISRVLLYLLLFGGLAVLVFWSAAAVEAVRSALAAGRDGGESDG